MRRATTYLAAALLAAPALAMAQTSGTNIVPGTGEPNNRVATRGANFLEIGVGARGQALAGAYVASARDVTAMYWNPAGVAHITEASANVSLTDLYGNSGIRHSFVGAVLPLGGSGAIGVNFIQLTSGDIERTTEAFPEGNDPAFGQTFSWRSTAAGIAYGRRLTDRLDFGAGVKFITEGIDNATASYVALDVGTAFQTGLYGTTVAAALTNLGTSSRFRGPLIDRFSFDQFQPGPTQVEFSTRSNPLPTAFRFGVRTELTGSADALLGSSMPNHHLAIMGEAFDAIDTDVNWTVAAEYNFRNLFFLRAGKRWVNEKGDDEFRGSSFGLSWGTGLNIPFGGGRRIGFDYALTNMGELKNVQVYSFSLGF